MTFLKVVEIGADDVDRHADVLARLRRDEIQALVVAGVYDAGTCERIVADLASNRHGFVRTFFPGPFKSSFLGMNLNLADPDLGAYFAAVPPFHVALAALLPGALAFETRIAGLLSRLDAGRPYAAAPGPAPSSTYMPTTFRAHDEGGYIPAHFDNEQTMRPSFRHLRTEIRGDVLSFVLTLGRANEGGFLEVFDARASEFATRFRNVDGASKPDLTALPCVAFDVPPGTLVVLRSGDRLHRVRPVGGPTSRWTACSFMAEARRGDGVHLWG